MRPWRQKITRTFWDDPPHTIFVVRVGMSEEEFWDEDLATGYAQEMKRRYPRTQVVMYVYRAKKTKQTRRRKRR